MLDEELELEDEELDELDEELELLVATPDDDELLVEDELLELDEELLDDEPLLPLPLIATSIQPWKRS